VRALMLDSNDPDKVNIKVWVLDQGIGIPEEAQQKLFMPFTQAESSTTRRFGGTGLGLSICQRLVEMMQGSIGVTSELGKGSEFYFTVSLARGASAGISPMDSRVKDVPVLLISSRAAEIDVCRSFLDYQGCDLKVMPGLPEKGTLTGPGPKLVIIGSSWDPHTQKTMQAELSSQPGLKACRFALLQPVSAVTPKIQNENTLIVPLNPLRQTHLLTSVLFGLGFDARELQLHSEPTSVVVAREISVQEALDRNCLILVAEDNATNRDVISRQLRILGYACEIAEDGVLALTAWRSGRYALLLSDINMPNMDGMELTRAVRSEEAAQKTTRRTPIIALTANALHGEEERYLALGMDDYITKPINMKVLQEKLARWLPAYTPEQGDLASTGDPVANISQEQVINEHALKDVFGDDTAVIKEILTDFLSPSAKILQEIHQGFRQNSPEAVQKAAHKLKSAARTVGANALADLCLAAEQAGMAGDLTPVADYPEKFDAAMRQVVAYIEAVK